MYSSTSTNTSIFFFVILSLNVGYDKHTSISFWSDKYSPNIKFFLLFTVVLLADLWWKICGKYIVNLRIFSFLYFSVLSIYYINHLLRFLFIPIKYQTIIIVIIKNIVCRKNHVPNIFHISTITLLFSF